VIERESKNWTWVNERPCDECGFDASTIEASATDRVLARAVDDWSELFGRHDVERLRRRPDPATWSPLEYACHVRDVLDLLDLRIDRVVREEHPTFDDWHPDDRAEAGRYDLEIDPVAVLARLVTNAHRVIDRIGGLSVLDWRRRGTRADGLEFTAAFITTYLTHDVVHHLHDVRRILEDDRASHEL